MSNSVLRVLTAIVGIPAVVGLLYLGGWPFAILVVTVALLAQHEVYRLLEKGGAHPVRSIGFVLGALLVLQSAYRPLLLVSVLVVLGALVWYPFDRREEWGDRPDANEGSKVVGTLPATLFGAIYPSAMIGFLLELRLARGPQVDDLQAFYLTLAVFLLVWATDTLAYYVGRAIGKRPLAPSISPKKTWAGAVAGVIGALAAAAALRLTVLGAIPWVHVIAVGLLAGTIGQLGDLAESKMKRDVGVKDSGAILPGHGGILDRFDAMILVAPAIYVYLRLVARLFG